MQQITVEQATNAIGNGVAVSGEHVFGSNASIDVMIEGYITIL